MQYESYWRNLVITAAVFLFKPEWQNLSYHLLEGHFIVKNFNRSVFKFYTEKRNYEDRTAEKRYCTSGIRNVMKEMSWATEALKKLRL